jgi:hypothetical protein
MVRLLVIYYILYSGTLDVRLILIEVLLTAHIPILVVPHSELSSCSVLVTNHLVQH